MKIITVAIPNHHFFQWVNQLKKSGYEVYWFDITDGGLKSHKIKWVNQIKGWKLKWDFPFRTRIKKNIPKLYSWIQKYNERSTSLVFQKMLKDIKPDIVHCFEMQLSGLPILSVMEQNKIPLIYSSWGSDVFYYKELGISNKQIKQFYKRVNYLITDCKRDYQIIMKNGFSNKFMGVFPGNGGLAVYTSMIKSSLERNIILIKGYDDGVGKASIILQAFEKLTNLELQNKIIIVYSADNIIVKQIANSKRLSELSIKIYTRDTFIDNEKLMELMGQSCIHIANSISDGMPNALIEAMAMGAFPIQSNPGRVTEEVITHNVNGYLINNPLNAEEVASHIKKALLNNSLREYAQEFNINFAKKHFKRATLQPKIEKLYNTIYKTGF